MKYVLFLLSIISCTTIPQEPQRILSGMYEVDYIEWENANGVTTTFNEGQFIPIRMTFSDSLYWHILQDDEWREHGSNVTRYDGISLIKVGCRWVTDVTDSSITWKQNDDYITRYFK